LRPSSRGAAFFVLKGERIGPSSHETANRNTLKNQYLIVHGLRNSGA
jgi:hypothetical protein